MKISGLKSLFLSTALLICSTAKTDAGTQPIQTRSHLDSTLVEKQSVGDKAPMGVLYIKGPEFKETPERIALAKETIILFNKAFSDTPHEVVGDGENDVSQEDIKNALKKLAQTSKSIGMIVGMHGSKRMISWPNDDPHEDEALWMENKMLNSLSSSEIFTSQDFYADIGEFLHEDPDFANIPVTTIHGSCHGNAALIGFTELPVGSTVITMSPHDDLSSDYMEKTFEYFQKLKTSNNADGSKWSLNQENFTLGILRAADKGYGYEDDRNHPFLIKIDREAADEVDVVYNQINKESLHHAHTQIIGRHGGTITDLQFIANNISGLYSTEEIQASVIQHRVSDITENQADILMRTVHNNYHCENVSTFLNRDDASMMYTIAYELDKIYNRTRQPISSYIKDNKMIIPVTPAQPAEKVQAPNFQLNLKPRF